MSHAVAASGPSLLSPGANPCPYRKPHPRRIAWSDQVIRHGMFACLGLLAYFLISLLKSRQRIETESVLLRHQLNVLRRAAPSKRRWHREGFRFSGGWKSRSRGGHPKIPAEVCRLIREMSVTNPLWGAPRYLIRDRDAVYGHVVRRRLQATGVRDRPAAPQSPWQNAYAERLVGSIRRDCLDHVIVFGEAHLRRILKAFANYYNGIRTHLSLKKDAPFARSIERNERIASLPILGGLHHRYCRTWFPMGTARRAPPRPRKGARAESVPNPIEPLVRPGGALRGTRRYDPAANAQHPDTSNGRNGRGSGMPEFRAERVCRLEAANLG